MLTRAPVPGIDAELPEIALIASATLALEVKLSIVAYSSAQTASKMFRRAAEV